ELALVGHAQAAGGATRRDGVGMRLRADAVLEVEDVATLVGGQRVRQLVPSIGLDPHQATVARELLDLGEFRWRRLIQMIAADGGVREERCDACAPSDAACRDQRDAGQYKLSHDRLLKMSIGP